MTALRVVPKMKMLLLVVTIFMLSMVVPSYAYTASDFFVGLVDSNSDLAGGYAVFILRNPTPISFTFNTANLNYYITGNSTRTTSMQILRLKNFTDNITDYTHNCTYTLEIINGTEDNVPNCTDTPSGYHLINHTDFLPLNSSETVGAFQNVTIKISATWIPTLGMNLRDWIPYVNVSGVVYEMPSWAWWNSSWSYRQNVTVMNTTLRNKTVDTVNRFISFSSGKVTNCSKEIRVINSTGGEVYSYISSEGYGGGYCLNATVTWDVNMTNVSMLNYSIYYGNPTAVYPNYPKPMIIQDNFEWLYPEAFYPNQNSWTTPYTSFWTLWRNSSTNYKGAWITNQSKWGGYGEINAVMAWESSGDHVAGYSAQTRNVTKMFNDSYFFFNMSLVCDIGSGCADGSWGYSQAFLRITYKNAAGSVLHDTWVMYWIGSPAGGWTTIPTSNTSTNTYINLHNTLVSASSTAYSSIAHNYSFYGGLVNQGWDTSIMNNVASITVNLSSEESGVSNNGRAWIMWDDLYLYGIGGNDTKVNTSLSSEEQGTVATTTQLFINASQSNISAAYGQSLNLTAQVSVAGLWVAILKNGTLISNGTTTTTFTGVLNAGYLNLTAFYGGNSSYSSSSVTYWANISKSAVIPNITITDGSKSINNTGLIGFWRLENSTISDSSGYARNGTISSYLYTKVINISTTQVLSNVYTVNLTGIDTAALISGGKMLANCQDLRVFYQNNTELDRIVSNCNSGTTFVEFRLRNAISSGVVDRNYSIFYGNTTAITSVPTNKSNVYWFADDFNTLDTSKWSTYGNFITVSGGVVNITATTGLTGIESKEKDFAPPFSLEMGNTYWILPGSNIVIRKQLNFTGYTTDSRAGLYWDPFPNEWLWFDVNNVPATGTACSFARTVSHNRTIVVWNTSLGQYYQDGALTCTNGTNQNISTSLNWSVNLELSTASGSISQYTDWVIVRRLANASTTPAVTLGAEGASPFPINGAIGRGISLANTNYISFNTINVSYNPFTVSLWVKSSSGVWTSPVASYIMNQPNSFAISSELTGLKVYWYNATHSFSGSLVSPANDNNWHSLIVVFSPSGSSIGSFTEFVDGTKYTISVGSVSTILSSAVLNVTNGGLIADAWTVQDQGNVNFGGPPQFNIQSWNAGGSDNCRGYELFNLSAQVPAGATINNCTNFNYFWWLSASTRSYNVSNTTSNTWTMYGITWNNQPGISVVQGTVAVPTPNVTHYWDVTPACIYQWSQSSKLLSLVVTDSIETSPTQYGAYVDASGWKVNNSQLGNLSYVESVTVLYNTTPTSVGNLYIGDLNSTFAGGYDEVMFYNRSLSDSEAQFLSRFTTIQATNYTYTCSGACSIYFGNTTGGSLTESSLPAGYDSRSLGAGSYYYYANFTDTENYTYANALSVGLNESGVPPAPTLSLTVTSPITYGTASNAHATESNTGDSDITYSLYRNITLIGTGSDVSDNTVLGVGGYIYIYNNTAGQNYSASSVNVTLTVTQASPSLSLSNNISWSGTYPVASLTTGSGCPSQLSCNLWRNGSSVSNPDGGLFAAGLYVYIWNASSNQNYTSGSVTNSLTISKASPTVHLYLNGTEGDVTYDYGKVANVTGWVQTPSGASGNLYRNGTSESNPDMVQLAMGVYNYSFNYSGNANYSSTSGVWHLLTVLNSAPIVYYIDSIPSKDPVEGSAKSVTFTASINDFQGYGDISVVNVSSNKTGDITRNGTCSVGGVINSTAINYSCSFSMMFYDSPGSWGVKVLALGGTGLSSSNWTSFTYNTLTAWNMTPHAVYFPGAYHGQSNILALNNTTMQNTGNLNLSVIQVNGTNLLNGVNVWNANNYSANYANSCGGTTLSNNAYVTVSGVSLSKQMTSSPSFSSLYYCINTVPLLPFGTYIATWTIMSAS